MESTQYTTDECNNKRYNILVVDDSKTFNYQISDPLREVGHTVTQTFNLKDTRVELEKNEFDFILLDLILPDGEGDELIDEMDAKTKSKVIVLSADTDMQRREHVFNSGILDYFSKSNPKHLLIHDILETICYIEQNRKVNILLVDDSSFMRKMMKNLLKPKQYNLLEAKDGTEAISIIATHNIHLMLCDLEMPGLDGAQVIEMVKKDKRYSELPIIVISSQNDKAVIARVLKHGAKDFIKKPFASEEFLLKCDLHVKDHLKVEYIKSKEKELEATIKRVQEAENHKSMFLANMSHEIRTPLNAILGFANLLKDDEQDTTKLEYLNTIGQSGDYLLGLINDILDFSKINNNKLDIVDEVFELSKLFSTMISMNKHNINLKNIDFKQSIDTDLPKYFKSDFLRIKQILTNFISNAIKFTPDNGEIEFLVKVTDDKKNIEFSIKDSGIGIDPANHKKIFEMFSQAEDTTTKKFGGTGLGLTISAKLVELLGGVIGVQSKIDKGARFYFTLPIKDFKKDEIIESTEDKIVEKELDDKLKGYILLVEDNKTNQALMSIILKKEGLEFDIAQDGIEAIDAFSSKKYDLILMDENMPQMNGSEACQIIREDEKSNNLQRTPIVALTANALKSDEERFKEIGMDEYLSKPVDREKLKEILKKYLG